MQSVDWTGRSGFFSVIGCDCFANRLPRGRIVMAYPIPEDIKQQATKLCEEYGYTLQDPGTIYTTDQGFKLVSVRDSKGRFLWLPVPTPTSQP
jgi:hypothetical protein